jgi:5-methylcytosine-specific restriction endonuclease McrA
MELTSQIIKKYEKKTVQQLVKKAQQVFNAWIRDRDLQGEDFFTCISCHVPKHKSQMNAGHYLSAGHHTHIRFNPNNCHGQCIKCNLYMSGNLIGYRIGLVNKIGLHKVIELEQHASRPSKYDRYNLIDVIETYKPKK